MRQIVLMVVLGVLAAVAGCGGGSGYEGPTTAPNGPTAGAGGPLVVSGAPWVTLAPVEFRQLAISGGQPPYSVTSQNTATVLATVGNGMLNLAGVRADATPVVVLLTDSATGAAKRTVSLAVTVTNTPVQGVMALSPDRLALVPNQLFGVEVVGGTPPFSVETMGRAQVDVSVAGRTVAVRGLLETAADVLVRVTDALGVVRLLPVSVISPPATGSGVTLFSNVPQPLILPSGATRAFTLGGGSGPYVVISSNPAVLLPTVRGNLLSLVAGVAGTGWLKVTDTTGAELWHSISVSSGVAPLALSATELGGATGSVLTAAVTGGRPPYRLDTDASGVAAAYINGSKLGLSLLAPGTGVITVHDSEQATVTLTVVATGLAVPTKFALSPTKVVISERLMVDAFGQAQQTVIVLNLGKSTHPVQVFSSAPQLLMPTVVGNTIEVRTPLGASGTPLPPCVDAEVLVTITVIDGSGQSAATDVTIRDAGACTG